MSLLVHCESKSYWCIANFLFCAENIHGELLS
jgi:hypothetical protein